MESSVPRSLQLVATLWKQLGLPESSLAALRLHNGSLPARSGYLPSSFHIDDLAQATIGLFHLAASQYHAIASGTSPRQVTISPLGAALEFKSETHFTINGEPLSMLQGFGGLHATRDGHVRIHDGFEVHRAGTRQILNLRDDADKADVQTACLERNSLDLEDAAFKDHAIIGALRNFQEWDRSPVGLSIPVHPIKIQELYKVENSKPESPHTTSMGSRCLEGIRVVELSRVIATPVAGRALAAHGAEVIWVTSPSLEDQPYLDRDFARGKRTVRLDLQQQSDLQKLKDLIRNADVFLQGYRPGSLARRGLGPEDLQKLNPKLIYGSMSAYPQVEGNPWRYNRGFDSIVQTCSGLNVAEAQKFNEAYAPIDPIPAKTLPCQALDHGSGFLLAAGIVTALCRRLKSGHGNLVEVSLAGTSRLLRSLGQTDGKAAFEVCPNTRRIQEVVATFGNQAEELFEEADSDFGRMKFVRSAGRVEGMRVGWDRMPRPLGSDVPEWA